MGEEFGFIDLIDFEVLRHVFRLLRDRPYVRVAVNVSVLTIEESCNELLSLVFKNMDLAHQVVFEITETAQINDMPRIQQFVAAVRLLNAKVAIDDFGDGFFTAPLVREIQPEYLKLSGDLVARLCSSGEIPAYPGSCALVRWRVDRRTCRLRRKARPAEGAARGPSPGVSCGPHPGRVARSARKPVVCSWRCEGRAMTSGRPVVLDECRLHRGELDGSPTVS